MDRVVIEDGELLEVEVCNVLVPELSLDGENIVALQFNTSKEPRVRFSLSDLLFDEAPKAP